MRSQLIPMIRGFLFINGDYRQPWQRSSLEKESDRIAAKIRDTFCGCDESSQELCASLIRAVMETQTTKPVPRRESLADARDREDAARFKFWRS